MSDFFDTLGAAARKAASSAATQISIAAEEQKVRQAYQAIGKLYYRQTKNGGSLTGDEFDARIAAADAALERIRSLKDAKTVEPDDYVTVE